MGRLGGWGGGGHGRGSAGEVDGQTTNFSLTKVEKKC